MNNKQFTGAFRVTPRSGKVAFGNESSAKRNGVTQDEFASARADAEVTMRRDSSSLLVADWQTLNGVLPISNDQLSVEVREKLFKELVVRAERTRERGGSRKEGRSFRGTLSLSEIETHLYTALERSGAVRGGCAELTNALGKSFHTARRCAEPVTILDTNHVDMNEFHILALYLLHYLELRDEFSLILERSGQSASSTSIAEAPLDLPRVEQLLALLTASTAGSLRGSLWASVDDFKEWAAEPRRIWRHFEAAAQNEKPGNSQVTFETFADLVLSRVIDLLPGGGGEANRKHAFQLLQALNNTPSLPNAVPGPLNQQAGRSTPTAGGPIDWDSVAPTKQPWVLRRLEMEKSRIITSGKMAPSYNGYSAIGDRGVRPTSTTWGGFGGLSGGSPLADGAGGVFGSGATAKRPGALQFAGGVLTTPRE